MRDAVSNKEMCKGAVRLPKILVLTGVPEMASHATRDASVVSVPVRGG